MRKAMQLSGLRTKKATVEAGLRVAGGYSCPAVGSGGSKARCDGKGTSPCLAADIDQDGRGSFFGSVISISILAGAPHCPHLPVHSPVLTFIAPCIGPLWPQLGGCTLIFPLIFGMRSSRKSAYTLPYSTRTFVQTQFAPSSREYLLTDPLPSFAPIVRNNRSARLDVAARHDRWGISRLFASERILVSSATPVDPTVFGLFCSAKESNFHVVFRATIAIDLRDRVPSRLTHSLSGFVVQWV